MPFIKLNAYEGEQEYRFTLEGGADAAMPTWLSFDAELVARVVVSPWMKDELLSNFSTEVKKISGLKHVDVVRSTVLEKTEWTEKISALSF